MTSDRTQEEVNNAIIRSADLTIDHGMLSGWLHLDYGGEGQGFGGYVLFQPNFPDSPGNYGGLWIYRVLEIVGVEKWSQLPGKTLRVRGSCIHISAIGNIVKDVWFDVAKEFKALEADHE